MAINTDPFLCNSSEITEHKYRSVRKMQILEENSDELRDFYIFTYSNINKGHFSFRKTYVITIIIQLIGNTLQ